MNARQIIFSLLLFGAAIYFGIKFLPAFEQFADNGASLLIVLLLLLGLGYMIYRILAE
ncbi:MAG: hypothetical protein H6573_11420 [Lewinellaceae bacterium]|nr:hypothetical protein [Phaeodactylibacter sp.]MCB9348098.1 hypothetical protein [Lewinellaceae bacterium]